MIAADLELGGADCAHKRMVVRSFAPHLNNAALARQERAYLALGLTRVVLVFVLPACVVFYLRDWRVRSPAAVVVAAVAGIELFVHLVRWCCRSSCSMTANGAGRWRPAPLFRPMARRTRQALAVLARGAS
jgi:hypothetical protein